jgi:putative transposase
MRVRYKATLVDTEQYLFACQRYIELNPVRAGLVADPRHYSWSSYAANALGATDPMITPHERYKRSARTRALGDRPTGPCFATRYSIRPSDEIRDTTNKGRALGGKRTSSALER